MAKVYPLHLLGILISTIIFRLSTTDAFFALGFTPSPRTLPVHKTSFTQLSLSSSSSSASTNKNVIVISPPGGLGEITSINSAKLGGHVKWFVVSASQQQQQQQQIALTSETLNTISNSGGSLDFAGASADTLLCNDGGGIDSSSSSNSALSAMSSWLLTNKEGDTNTKSSSIICTYDGALEEKKRINSYKSQEEIESSLNNEDILIKNGIKLAARMAVNTLSSNNNGGKSFEMIALLSATEEVGMMSVDDNNDSKGGENNGGVGGFIGELFGGGKDNTVDIPTSLNGALGGGLTTVVRYGDLFGAPESSVRYVQLVLGGVLLCFGHSVCCLFLFLSICVDVYHCNSFIPLTIQCPRNRYKNNSLNHHHSWEDHDVIPQSAICTHYDRHVSTQPFLYLAM